MRIYFDMDGVLVDLMAGWLPPLNEMTGLDLSEEDIYLWGLEKIYNIPFSKLRKPVHRPGFWESLPPYPGAVEFVKSLSGRGYEIHIATTPFPSDNCAWEKKLWVETHLPFLPYNRLNLIHNKGLLRGDVLIDDKPENLIGFVGIRILFDRPWNKVVSPVTKNRIVPYYRAFNWKEIAELLDHPRPDLY